MGLKWFPWGSFCPSASNRPELYQFRPFFWGNVWIHLPCFQHSGIELLSLKGLKFLFSELHGISWHFLSNIWHPRWVSKRDWVTWMGLKWFAWGSFCASTSNRPELDQFRPFFWGNVWIHRPCSQLWVVLYDGFVFSILAMNSFLSTKSRFIFSELRGTFKEIFGTLDGFPKGIGSLGWIWNGFHAVHSAHQHPIDQKYTTFSEQSMFEFTDLVFNCDGGVLGLFWFGILDFRFFWSWILDFGILDLRFLDFWILECWILEFEDFVILGCWILEFWILGLNRRMV